METIGDITVEHSAPESVVVYIKQDDDVVVVYRDEIVGLVDALRGYSPSPIEEEDPSPHVTAGGENLRMTLMIARANLLVKKQDVAYEEGRISVLNSIMED